VTDSAPRAAARSGPGSPPPDVRRWLPWIGIAVALWATLPKYSGPTLVTEPSKEVVDHIIPGILVAAACLACLVLRRRPEGPGLVPFFAGTVVLLAGFWMVATHVPLLAQATRGDAPWPATIYHSSSAFAVFGFGLLWAVTHWGDLAAAEAAEAAEAAPAAEKGQPSSAG
jgi:hypothetical protein